VSFCRPALLRTGPIYLGKVFIDLNQDKDLQAGVQKLMGAWQPTRSGKGPTSQDAKHKRERSAGNPA